MKGGTVEELAPERDPTKVPGIRHDYSDFEDYYSPDEGDRYDPRSFLRDLRHQLKQAGLSEEEIDKVMGWAEYRLEKLLEHRSTPVTSLPVAGLRKKAGQVLDTAYELNELVGRLTEDAHGLE